MNLARSGEIMGQDLTLRDRLAWRPIQKIRAAQMAPRQLDQEWRGHVASRSIRIEEHRVQAEHAICFVLRILDPDVSAGVERQIRSCISDGRSSLSNLVHELAQREGANDRDLKISDFPITSTEANWSKAATSRLKSLPPEVTDHIASVQPCRQTLPSPRLHPLQVLSELNNVDRHRAGLWIAPEFGSATGLRKVADVQYEVTVERHEEELNRLKRPDLVAQLNPRSLTDGEIVMRLEFPDWLDVTTDVTISNPDIQLYPALVSPEASPDHYPLLRELSEALVFARATIHYVAGIDDDPPEPQPRVRTTW